MRYRAWSLLHFAAGRAGLAAQAGGSDPSFGRARPINMPDTSPTHTAFDRAAATILGGMITLIAALSFVLVQASVEHDDERMPVAASVAGVSGTR